MIIPFLSSTLAKMKDILTWDPRRVRNWGSRYFLEPRKNEKIKSLKHSIWGSFPDKATELSEVSIMADSQALEKGTKSVQLLSRVGSTQSRAYMGHFSQYTAQVPEKAASSAFPSKHPSCHFSFFLACLFLNSTLNHLPLTGQVPLHMGIFAVWWALAIFPYLDLLRFLMPLLQT